MSKLILRLALILGLAITTTAVHAQSVRDYINVVGSSTVYPFATVVAEQFGRGTNFKTPKIESTGSGGGMKLFCSGVGPEYPDISNSSRRIKQSEVDQCKANGVPDIIEMKIGYDGIVLANSRRADQYDLSRRDIFLALARDIPDPSGKEAFVKNPHTTWKDVNPDLPAIAIEVLGPPPTSGTRDAFVELAMEGGCSTFAWINALKKSDKNTYKARCHTMREDGAFVEAGENDNLIVQKLDVNPDALGIFGFSFLDQNSDKVQGSKVDGVDPSFEAIAAQQYPVSRPLYSYIKKAHVGIIPGIEEFLDEFTSERAWGPEGYLSDRGMIPLPDFERGRMYATVNLLGLLNLPEDD